MENISIDRKQIDGKSEQLETESRMENTSTQKQKVTDRKQPETQSMPENIKSSRDIYIWLGVRQHDDLRMTERRYDSMR
jgi:hypothetical protein